MIHPNRLLTTALQQTPNGDSVARVLAAALQAVDPGEAVRRHVYIAGDTVVVGAVRYALSPGARVFVVGAGKAAGAMAAAVSDILGERIAGGVVIDKLGGAARALPRIELRFAAHPTPDERGVAGAQHIAELLADTRPDDLVLVLISGGGSALLTLPASDVSLADMQTLTGVLLRCGAPIEAINTLRKHLDSVKGGGLARLAAPAHVATLILSDVVGNPLDVIASGPTVPDSSTWADAWALVERFGIIAELPHAVAGRLQAGLRGELPDTPKAGDPIFMRVQNQLVGSNIQAAEAALAVARAEGLSALLLSSYVQGEAREVGRVVAALARELVASGNPLPRPACLVVGGETTVTLRGDGLGGRNQELALAAVADLAGLPNVALVSLATDGGDGPTDAAGAVVTGETLGRAKALGLDPHAFLARNDAYNFFEPLSDLLKLGPTGTNVNDLAFVFAW